MNKITSITAHTTAEGQRLSFTYSTINENGQVTANNKRSTYVVLETEDSVLAAIETLKNYCAQKLEG